MKDNWKSMDKGVKLIYDTMDKAIKQLREQQKNYGFDTVSDCCEAPPFLESKDLGICPDCKEHCEYVCEQCHGEGVYEEYAFGSDVEVICEYCNAYKNQQNES
jgi:hypothetical protein